mmetsp:Transcript_25701/g.39519  ORF Transcript_25701/g.39519 Transcript_25701/m.39519 type:complete len:101 (-) Transcript_25701:3-305(-)
MYVTVMGSSYYRFFFGLFFYFSVIIGINIVVAFTLDMYSSVERLDEERIKTLEMLEDELIMNNQTINKGGKDYNAAMRQMLLDKQQETLHLSSANLTKED